MRYIEAWQGFAQRQPVGVTAALTLLFTVWVVGISALDSVVYDGNMPSPLFWTISALYLAATFVAGLLTPLRTARACPVIAFAAVTFLWPLTPWESYDDLTYDSGWAGAVLNVAVPSAVIWFVGYAGSKFGSPEGQSQ